MKALCLWLGLAAVAGLPAVQQTVIRSTVVGVRLVVRVTSGAQPVTSLTAADFAVSDAGSLQVVDAAKVASQLSAAVVIDTSRSVRYGTFGTVSASARAVISGLGAADRAAILTVSDHSTLLQAATADHDAWRRAADAIPVQGMGFTTQTAIWDGVMFGASQAALTDGVSLVVLITDGRDNASWLSRTDVGRTLQRLGVAVDVLGVSTPGTTLIVRTDGSPPGPGQKPDDLVNDSGGRFFDANDGTLAAKLEARFAELRSSYVLTYTPRGVKADDGWHPVRVRVPNRNVTVKAQSGYYAGR